MLQKVVKFAVSDGDDDIAVLCLAGEEAGVVGGG
jgi:hypothetical protein